MWMSATDAGATGMKQSVEEVKEKVSDQAAQAKQEGRRQLRDQLDERTTDVGRQARSLAEALRRSGTEVGQGSSSTGVERISSGVADRLEQAGSYLEEAKGEELLRDAERFVRSRPWVVAGAAALTGFAVSRVFKASSERRYSGSPSSMASGAERGMYASTPEPYDEQRHEQRLQTAAPA
jgi:ElaB/YqjD/DUF883 family membrane-anchored ribosome-binding protein